MPQNRDPLTPAVWLNYCIPCSYNPHSLKKKKTTDIITWNKFIPQHWTCKVFCGSFFMHYIYFIQSFNMLLSHCEVWPAAWRGVLRLTSSWVIILAPWSSKDSTQSALPRKQAKSSIVRPANEVTMDHNSGPLSQADESVQMFFYI